MSDKKRSLGWWIQAILAPIGISTSPIAIADLVSGLIEWKGPIGYVVNWWDVNISIPFGYFLTLVANWISFPAPTPFWTDYIALGVLSAVSLMRGTFLMTGGADRFRLIHLTVPIAFVVFVFIWPLYLILIPLIVREAIKAKEEIGIYILWYMPWFLFILMWIANSNLIA